MGKPDWCPQEVWDEAESLDLDTIVRRAILAAKAEERQNIDDLVDCLLDMTFHYVALAGCGDCGNWNPEEESEVIAARQMIARHRDVNAAHKNSVEA